MKSDTSFTATIGFALLALASLVACNLLGALQGSTSCALGVAFAVAAIGAAYGSQFFTSQQLYVEENMAAARTETDLQALREGAQGAQSIAVLGQQISIGAATVSWVLLVVGLLW